MTFEKALLTIELNGRYHKNEFNIDSKRKVVPENPEDYKIYLEEILLKKAILTDEDSKRFSTDNNFAVGSFPLTSLAEESFKL
ncbi:hypothetical protein [Flavobacterium sp.]|uniref:hypothetical protein n=1 Tax=Flavobacterium sp. TaxID=239 RepID=UPI004048899F